MPVPNTLADIRTKVRRLTARTSVTQITDNEIDNYVNTYYLYDMPESLRLLKLDDTFSFETQPNIEVYPFLSNTNTLVEPPVYCGGQQINFFENNELFYRQWPKTNFIQQINTGNGTPGPYIGVIPNAPFLRSVNPASNIGKSNNVIFSANITASSAAIAIDDGNGAFLAPNVGQINYVTGAYNLTFSVPIPASIAITCSTIPYAAAQPRSLLFWQNQFFVRPIPDQVYEMQINCQRVPTDLINANDTPELNEWWQLLAFGAALKILVDNGDFTNVSNLRPFYDEQFILAMRRTIREGASQRSATIYAENNSSFSNFYPYI